MSLETLDNKDRQLAQAQGGNFRSSDDGAQQLLDGARATAAELGLAYAGSVTPPQAWQLTRSGAAFLVDVRSFEEYKFVGHVPSSLHVPWATGTALNRNPRFVKELEAKVKDKDAIVLLLCRSGNRSALAAEAAHKAGFTNVFNVAEGFEGDLNERLHRGTVNGWRRHDLPWEQD